MITEIKPPAQAVADTLDGLTPDMQKKAVEAVGAFLDSRNSGGKVLPFARGLQDVTMNAETLAVDIFGHFIHLSKSDQAKALAHIVRRFDALELADILEDIQANFQPVTSTSTGAGSNVIPFRRK